MQTFEVTHVPRLLRGPGAPAVEMLGETAGVNVRYSNNKEVLHRLDDRGNIVECGGSVLPPWKTTRVDGGIWAATEGVGLVADVTIYRV
jgi:hypothetical protein